MRGMQSACYHLKQLLYCQHTRLIILIMVVENCDKNSTRYLPCYGQVPRTRGLTSGLLASELVLCRDAINITNVNN
jgi:hypothetical protein